jgi:hypothetical protein
LGKEDEGIEGAVLMGLLFDWLESKGLLRRDKRFWLMLLIDAIIIIYFIHLSLHAREEFDNGFNFCREHACAICAYDQAQQNYQKPNISLIFNFSNFTE